MLTCALCVAGCAEKRDLPVASDCHVGLYRNAAGEVLAISPADEGAFRWRTLDGRTGKLRQDGDHWVSTLGWTEEPDGIVVRLGECADDEIRFGPSNNQNAYTRVPLEIQDTTFESNGLTLSGRLIWPAGAPRAPLVVEVHGSERYSGVRNYPTSYLLAAEGIASFVYDKRGTGRSEGVYSQDFFALAQDARAAMAEARRLSGDRIERAGFLGGSQGGWIGPLAAGESDADFVVALYGMAEGALAEDRNEVVLGLAAAGWGEAEQAKGAELANAAGAVIGSDFQSGFQEFDRLRQLYRGEPWYRDVHGEFTGEMLPYPEIALRLAGPVRDLGTSWEYDPVPVLRALTMPQFWVLAADDTEAPMEETARRLRVLQGEGRPIDLAIYPNAEHGMTRIERGADGEIREIGYVPNYFRQIAAWIRDGDLSLAREAGADVSTAQMPPIAAAP